MMESLSANGYTEIQILYEQVCAPKHFNFTTALVVGADDMGNQRRYCYEHNAEAQAALLAWDGHAHPPGSWIKSKGSGIDRKRPVTAS